LLRRRKEKTLVGSQKDGLEREIALTNSEVPFVSRGKYQTEEKRLTGEDDSANRRKGESSAESKETEYRKDAPKASQTPKRVDSSRVAEHVAVDVIVGVSKSDEGEDEDDYYRDPDQGKEDDESRAGEKGSKSQSRSLRASTRR